MGVAEGGGRARRLMVEPGTSFERAAALVPGRFENEKT